MKKLLTLLVLAFLLAGTASAQHYRGGWQHQRHGGHGGWGWVAPAVIGAGAAYLIMQRQYAPPPEVIYYDPPPVSRVVIPTQQPIVVEGTVPVPCTTEQQRVTDQRGRPLYDQYTGRPLVRLVQICSAPVPTQ